MGNKQKLASFFVVFLWLVSQAQAQDRKASTRIDSLVETLKKNQEAQKLGTKFDVPDWEKFPELSPAEGQRLFEMLKDPNLKEFAIHILYALNPQKRQVISQEKLLSALKGPDGKILFNLTDVITKGKDGVELVKEKLLNFVSDPTLSPPDRRQAANRLRIIYHSNKFDPAPLVSIIKNKRADPVVRERFIYFAEDPEFGSKPEVQSALFEIAENNYSLEPHIYLSLEMLSANNASPDRLLKLIKKLLEHRNPAIGETAGRALSTLAEKSSAARQHLLWIVEQARKNPKSENAVLNGFANSNDNLPKIYDLTGLRTWNSQLRCEALCGVAQAILDKKIPKAQDLLPRDDEVEDSWEAAMDQLNGLFLLKASKVCINQKLSVWAHDFFSQTLKGNTKKDTRVRLEPFSAYKIYIEQFKVQTLKEFLARKDEFKISPEQQKKMENQLDRSFSSLAPMLERNMGATGSAANTYAWATSLVAAGNPKGEKTPRAFSYPQFQLAKTELEDHLKEYPTRFAYNWKVDDRRVYTFLESESAARSVPANLANFLNHPGSDDAQANLLLALNSYSKNLNILVNHFLFFSQSGNSFHNSKEEGIASYYFPASVPYAQSAIEILLQQPSALSSEQVEFLKTLRERINEVLLSQIDQEKKYFNGIAQYLKKNQNFRASPQYVSALGGLALLSGLGEECLKLNDSVSGNISESKNLFGIVSSYDFEGPKNKQPLREEITRPKPQLQQPPRGH